MRVRLDTVLDCSAERAFEEVLKPGVLLHVAAPLIRFRPLRPAALPAEWSEGRFLVGMSLFGLIPLGTQWVGIELPATRPGEYRVRDNGGGGVARRWDHLITLRARPDGRCDYRDEVEVEAGWMTPVVALFARAFYAHRQRRWRRLVRRRFRY